MIVVVYHTKVHLLDRVYIIVDNTMRDTVTRITDTFEDDRSFCGVLGRYISIVVAYSQIGRTFCEPCKVFIHNCGWIHFWLVLDDAGILCLLYVLVILARLRHNQAIYGGHIIRQWNLHVSTRVLMVQHSALSTTRWCLLLDHCGCMVFIGEVASFFTTCERWRSCSQGRTIALTFLIEFSTFGHKLDVRLIIRRSGYIVVGVTSIRR